MSAKIPPILFWGKEVNPILAAFIGLILLCVCSFPVFLSSIIPRSSPTIPISDEPIPTSEPSASRTMVLPTLSKTPITVNSSPTVISTLQNSITPATARTQTTATRPTPSRTLTTAAATSTRAPIGSCPQGCTSPPPGCAIKGNISSSGEKIYHVPGGASYNQTLINPSEGERWFCTEAEAVANGWRASLR